MRFALRPELLVLAMGLASCNPSWARNLEVVARLCNVSPCFKMCLNLLATDFFFQILAHPVFKM